MPESADIIHNSPIRRQWQDYGMIKDKVVYLLEHNSEGLTGAKIAETIGITQGAMSKYLSMLSVDGIIVSRRIGVAKLWKLTSSIDRTDLLAGKLDSETLNFKDYAQSIVENDGKLFDPDNKRVLAMPTTILINLFEYTMTILGSEVHPFFYEWGKSYTNATADLVKNMAEKGHGNFIQAFLALLRLKGWGRFSINTMNEESIDIVWLDSIWSDTRPEGSTPVDDFMVGALAEAASFTYKGEWKFTEVECRSMGANLCRFKGTNSIEK